MHRNFANYCIDKTNLHKYEYKFDYIAKLSLFVKLLIAFNRAKRKKENHFL